MTKENIVIYHANCIDGFGSAYSAWKNLGDSADYFPMSYGDTLPDIKDKNVFILDFSFPVDIYNSILEQAKSVKLLDHHVSAYKSLCNCKGCFFDLNKSGAMLSWEFFNKTPAPRFIKYVQDGDLYKFKHPETIFFYKSINILEKDFKVWEKLEDEAYLNNFIDKGQELQKFWISQLNEVVSGATDVYMSGIKGSILNVNGLFTSDVGNMLYSKNGTFALLWRVEGEKVKCSLRSTPNIDVSLIAQKYGGGGHAQASAFILNSLEDFQKMLQEEKELFLKQSNTKKMKP